ncbi:MAG TPA: YwmB family TATA-box binding protein [Clostridia bacterium]|nr:YwmB family TATA-box binding protein [Clostridia bacterium]
MRYRIWIIGMVIAVLCTVLYTDLTRERLNADSSVLGSRESVIVDELLEASGCRWTKTDISAWAVLGFEIPSGETLKEMSIEAGEALNLDMEAEPILEKYGETMEINLQGNGKNGLKYDIIIVGGKNAHMIINVLSNDRFVDSQIVTNQLDEYFHSINTIPRITTTFVGDLQGELNAGQRQTLVRSLIRGLKGSAIQSMVDDRLISIAGYSPMVETSPMDGINFQIASRYNEYMDKTYLWIGTPVITTEY